MKKKILFILSLGYFFIATKVNALPLYNPLGSGVDVPTLIGRIINIVVGVVGAIALLMFIYGGFLWMTSAGDSGRIDTGKKTLTWAALGLIVIFTARTILTFLFTTLQGS